MLRPKVLITYDAPGSGIYNKFKHKFGQVSRLAAWKSSLPLWNPLFMFFRSLGKR